MMKPCLPMFRHIRRYYDPVNQCVSAKLLPGQFYVTRQEEMITTVLGSCVSACLYDRRSGHGGMNHFMLPGSDSADAYAQAKYGLHAMESLINELLKLGARREDLRAKLFGGGRIIARLSDIGRQNVEFACRYLEDEGIVLTGSDLGLDCPRKINFFPVQGRALVKRLRSLNNNTIEARERAYLDEIRHSDISGDIELFD